MWSASVDPARALLQLAYAKRVDSTEVAACAKRACELLAELSPGFTLLTDLSGLEQMELDCEPLIGLMMDEFNRHGIRKVVRVVPEPRTDIGFGIMSLFHYGEEVQMVTCQSLLEAQQELP